MMAKITNLNQFRKQQNRAKKRAQADVNAAKFGRSKAEREREADEAERAERLWEAHRRDEAE